MDDSDVQPVAQSKSAFRKTTETFVSGAKTLPQKYFVSTELLGREREKIFTRSWILVGHQSQLANPGDYFLATIANESLIIIRDSKLALRAFFNVCRHRGTRLCEELTGHVRAIQCPYHAWTYALDGSLIGAPHMEEISGFDKSDFSLHPAHVGLWEGFVFVNLAESPIPLAKWFTDLTGKFSQWNLPNLRSAKRIEYDVKANWKLIFENYSECYHCPGVHPALSKISPYDSAENDLTEGPFLGGFMRINRGKSLTMSGNACAIPVGSEGPPSADGQSRGGEKSPPGAGPEEHEQHRVFYYSIFPNMLLSMHPDYVMVHQIWPQKPDRTLIYCDWFFHPDAVSRPDFKPNDAVEFWDMTNKQDWHVCELSQQGISSCAYEPGPFSARESIPAAWDKYYLSIMQ